MLPFASTLIRFVKAPPRAPIARVFLCSSSGGRRNNWLGPLLASDGKTFKEFTKCSSSVAVTPAITRPPLHLPHMMAHDADFQLARIRAKTAAARARSRNHQANDLTSGHLLFLATSWASRYTFYSYVELLIQHAGRLYEWKHFIFFDHRRSCF